MHHAVSWPLIFYIKYISSDNINYNNSLPTGGVDFETQN